MGRWSLPGAKAFVTSQVSRGPALGEERRRRHVKREEGHAEKTGWVKAKLRDAGPGEALLCARPRAGRCGVAAGQSVQATVWKGRRRLGVRGSQSSKAFNLYMIVSFG